MPTCTEQEAERTDAPYQSSDKRWVRNKNECDSAREVTMRSLHFVIFAGLVLAAPTRAGAQGVITVKDVEALYDAVNDPAHAGAEVRVAGGRKYRLTFQKRVANGSTVTRPNEGRLVLQPGMSLVGDND